MDSQSHMIPYSDCGTQLPRPTRHHTETSDLIRHPTCVGFTMQWQDNHRRLNLGRESHTERREALNLLLLSQLPSPRSIHKRYSVDVSCLPDEIDSPCHYSSQPDKQQFTGADWATTADKRLPPQSSGKTILKKPATRQQAADVSFFHPQKSIINSRHARPWCYTSGNIGNAVGEFPRVPTLLGLLNTYSKQIGPRFAVSVASSEDPHLSVHGSRKSVGSVLSSVLPRRASILLVYSRAGAAAP